MNIPLQQRGAAALGVSFLLLFVLTLVVGFASRNLIFEQRSSANQARSTQAFEAAEAGLQWAQAMLNSGTPIGADCEASAAPGDAAFRERFLAYDAASQRFAPRTWDDAGTPVALQAACVLDERGWSCSCPSAGHPTLAAPVGRQGILRSRCASSPRRAAAWCNAGHRLRRLRAGLPAGVPPRRAAARAPTRRSCSGCCRHWRRDRLQR